MILFLTALVSAISAGTSLLLATLGEIVTEKSGIINLGLEGLMLVGALSGFAVSHYTGLPIMGLIAAGISGSALSAIHAFLVVTLNSNQVVSGLALGIFGSGLSSFFGHRMIGQIAPGFKPLIIDLDIVAFGAFGSAFILWAFLKYTRWGLNLISVGHNPLASDVAGLNVFRIRYSAIIFGGALAGMGGAYLSLAYTRMWIENMVAGRGWIAIALVIFSAWDPIKALLGAYLFGAVIAVTLRVQAVGVQIPVFLLSMAPYIVTILALVFITVSGSARKRFGAPESLGLPFERK